MIFNAEQFKNACTKISKAIDNKIASNLTGMLELISINGNLYLNVTNKEYFVSVKLCESTEEFHATINSDVFLNLVSKFTTTDIEFNIVNTALVVKANGTYKFPLIYDTDNTVLVLPKIIIGNPTLNMNIDGSILNSIATYNSKELLKLDSKATNIVNRFYYIDEQGAITFSSGACVNKFTLEKPVKMLLTSSLVKLFKLFKNIPVSFTLGYDQLANGIVQTKVEFITDDIEITAILNSDDSLIQKIPVQPVRDRAFNQYPYSVTINRNSLLNSIQRLCIVNNTALVTTCKSCGTLQFTQTDCTISDYTNDNHEVIPYANELTTSLDYTCEIDLSDIKLALESSNDQYVTINFGDHKAFVVAKDNIYTVIPEVTNNEQ